MILVLFIIAFINQFYFIVLPGDKAFKVRLGAIQGQVYDDGFHFKLPFVESVVTMSVQTQKHQVGASAASKDLQTINADVALNFSLNPALVNKLYQQIGTLEEIENRVIGPAIQESIKATTAKFTAEELITKRELVSSEMKDILTTKLQTQGIQILDVNIIDFKFSEDFNQAIEKKVKAEQDALAEKNTLEKIKYEAQQAVEQARGESEATLLKAKAQAEAIRIQSEAIQKQGGSDYVSLKWIEKRNGILPGTMLGNQVPFVNIK